MASLAVGAARSVVEGTLAKVQSTIETETELRQSAQSDLAFITEEFQMMQSFLQVVDERRAKNKVVGTWVGQVRDLAYDVEDGMEFVVHLDTKPNWWHWHRLLGWGQRYLLPCMPQPLDKAVAELKQLKARVEDVSHRNTRYSLISESGFTPDTTQQQQPSAVIGETSLDMLTELRATGKMHHDFGTLNRMLMSNEGSNEALRVIWVWGTADDLDFMTIVRKAYRTPDICQLFPYRGWYKLTHPFSPHEVIRGLMAQFYYTNSCLQSGAATVDVSVDELEKMDEAEAMRIDHMTRKLSRIMDREGQTTAMLIDEFKKQAKEKRYLVVLENVSTMGQWDAIRTFLPETSNKGSLVIVCTQQREIANMCVADSYRALELKYYSACVLFKEGPQVDGSETYSIMQKKKEKEDKVKYKDASDLIKHYHRMPTSIRGDAAQSWKEQFSLVGRESHKNQLRNCLINIGGSQVLSVWGIPGVGKTTLVTYLYCEEMLIKPQPQLEKFSWVDLSHSFILREFCQNLLSDLRSESSQASGSSQALGVEDPIEMCSTFLKEHRCLVVVDGLHSNEEWDLMRSALVPKDSQSVIIVITNDASIAMRCADSKFVINVTCLEPEAAKVLFRNEVDIMDSGASVDELIPKCGGIPKVIVAIADVLAPQTPTTLNIATNLNTRFMHELENNPDLFRSVQGIFCWMDSFINARPDFLKQCLLYLSIFPRQHIIRRRRLVRRWIAEGYCKDTESSSEQRGEWSFSRLVDLCMIQQPPHYAMSMIQQLSQSAIDVLSYRRMIFCQVNNFVGEYIFSRPMEEKLVLQLKDRFPLTTQSTGRHLVIQDNWDRDIIVFESIDFSRLRSLTVFGEWRSFFISKSMRVLRVLDLEDAYGVTDKDLKKMVKLLRRLKFLSLRGCTDIRHLPSSLGVLRQLETLDVRETSITTIPVNITKLKKLQYLRAGTAMLAEERSTPSRSSRLFEFKRRQKQQADGVKVARGIEKLTALHTLGVVNVSDAGGEAILKELKKLTQLHKLGVSGIDKKNIKELYSAISCHAHLESLLIRFSKGNQDCLDDTNLPPGNLRSFKLFGFVKGLPAWIKDLHKLTKLDLEITMSKEVVGIIQVLGEIRELSILRLCVKLLQGGDCTHRVPDLMGTRDGLWDKLTEDEKLPERGSKPNRPQTSNGDGESESGFEGTVPESSDCGGDRKLDFIALVNGLECRSFEKLKILEIACTSPDTLHVSFGSESMINLELLTVRCCSGSTVKFAGLEECLCRLKEVWLVGSHDNMFKEDLEKQFEDHPNKPPLKQVEEPRSSHRPHGYSA